MKKIYLFLLLTVSVAFLNNAKAQYTGTGTFTQISNIADLTDGYYVITNAAGNVAMSNSFAGTFLATATVTPSAGVITDPAASIVWKIETNGAGKTIFNEAVASYTSYTGASNNVQMVSAVVADNQRWTFTNSVSTFTITNVALNTRKLQYNTSAPRFACYTGTQQNLALYKMGAAASGPEINIRSGATNYLNNSTYNFGTVVTSTTVVTTFAIQNLGVDPLNLTTASFTGASEYTINGAPIPATVAAGDVLTFSVEFTPTAAGTFTGVLSLESDDSDENPYLFNVTGVGNVPAPEINIIGGATNYLNNSTYDFGTVVTSTTVVTTFAVQNLGIATLNLTTASFTGSSMYIVNGAPIPATIAPGDVLTFSFEYTPTAAGTHTGVLSISSDDADENPYLFNVNGVGVAALTPEINIVQSATSYTSGSTYAFSNTDQNWYTDAVFTIENLGNAALSISTYSITGAEYSLIGTMPTSVAASSVASFTLRFAPTALGTFTGSITLTNNDANESSYLVNLSGVAVLGTPAIFTENFGTPTANTAITAYTGWSSTGLTFTGSGDIRNTTASAGYFGATGLGNVFLTNVAGRNIEISNINTSTCSSFTLAFGVYKSATTADGSTLAVEVSSDGTNYTALTFDPLPTGAGTAGWYYRTASGTIPQAANLRIRFTNTSTLAQFRIDDVTLKGSCAPAPEINIVQSATTYLSGSTYNFGTVAVSSSNVVIFTIQNAGNADLTISNSTDAGAAEFTTTSTFPIPLTIAAGNTATFSVTFAPTAVGTYNGSITFDSNDSNEPAYVLSYTGVASTTAPEINLTQNGANFLTGATHSFGSVNQGTTNMVTFTVQNIGTASLTLSTYSFTGSSDFSVSSDYPLPHTVLAGQTSTFTITLAATAVGTITGAFSFSNDDASENPYLVNVSATVVSTSTATAPEINVKQATTSIASSGTHDFGSVTTGTKDVVFTIENTGTAALTISSNTITGAQYSLVGAMPTSVAAGSTADFTVQFSSTTPGAYVGNITIANNDANEASYVINFTASVPTSIEETKADDAISIYPNPNKGTILHFTKATDATIYNAIGAKVMEVKNADKVDVSVLENGIYMVNINNKTKRLIIAK